MLAQTRQGLTKLIKIDFIRFCIVGGIGFLVNLGLLIILNNLLGIGIFIAQLISAEIALFSNFILHDHWTYSSKKVKKTKKVLIIQFHASSWPAILGSTMVLTAAHKFLHLDNFKALILTAFVTLFWNFVWSKYVIWKGVTERDIERIIE